MLEQYVLSLVLQYQEPKKILELLKKHLQEYVFETPVYQKIIEHLNAYKEQGFVITEFAKTIPQELIPAFDQCYLFPLPKFGTDQKWHEEIEKVGDELVQLQLKKQLEAVGKEIKKKEGENADSADLEQTFSRLVAKLEAFKNEA
jgi:hypothetical protein